MKRSVLLLMTTMAVLLLASGIALAANIQCAANKACKGTPDPDTLTGTNGDDNINPFNGNDTVYGDTPVKPLTNPPSFTTGGNDYVHHSYGHDKIYGGPGKDTLRGGFDNDEIWGGDGADLIDCAYVASRDKGEAYDIAHADSLDTVVDCKTIEDDPTSKEPPREPT